MRGVLEIDVTLSARVSVTDPEALIEAALQGVGDMSVELGSAEYHQWVRSEMEGSPAGALRWFLARAGDGLFDGVPGVDVVSYDIIGDGPDDQPGRARSGDGPADDDGGTAGVREPRRPFPPGGSGRLERGSEA
jgi:hypothetical protein